MKILVTGFNNEQTHRDFFLRKELKILNSHYSLIRCLEDIGHQVDQRTVEIGEDLSGYDRVVVYMSTPRSYAHRVFDGFYTIQARPDCILAFDDWQLKTVLGSIESYRKKLDEYENFFDWTTNNYMADIYQGSTPREKLPELVNMFKEACDIILTKQNDLLLCTFDGGDNSKFGLKWKGKICNYDPNPYNLNRGPHNNFGEPEEISLDSFFGDTEQFPTPFAEKKKLWVYSSIVQSATGGWFNKQMDKMTWDAAAYGSRRPTKGTVSTERVKEYDMCKIYSWNWGCLMPSYYHSGGGWWRSRIQQVADVKSILLCDDLEGAVLGEAFVGNSIDKIEAMDIGQLTELAENQYQCFYDNHPLDKARQQRQLMEAFKL